MFTQNFRLKSITFDLLFLIEKDIFDSWYNSIPYELCEISFYIYLKDSNGKLNWVSLQLDTPFFHDFKDCDDIFPLYERIVFLISDSYDFNNTYLIKLVINPIKDDS